MWRQRANNIEHAIMLLFLCAESPRSQTEIREFVGMHNVETRYLLKTFTEKEKDFLQVIHQRHSQKHTVYRTTPKGIDISRRLTRLLFEMLGNQWISAIHDNPVGYQEKFLREYDRYKRAQTKPQNHQN